MIALNQKNTYNTTDIEGIFPARYVTPKFCVITNLSNQASQSTWILSLCLCFGPISDPGIKMFFRPQMTKQLLLTVNNGILYHGSV